MLYFLWLCSLCNTKATSKQALLLHAEGKKHGAKARAFHASQQPPVQTDKPAPDAKDAVETASNGTAKDDKNAEQPKLQESSEQNNLKPGTYYDVLNQSLVDLSVSSGLFDSKSAARRLLKQGGLYLNNSRVDSENKKIEAADIVDGRVLLLSAGKKNKSSRAEHTNMHLMVKKEEDEYLKAFIGLVKSPEMTYYLVLLEEQEEGELQAALAMETTEWLEQ
ncbi:tyrosine--tRNA ligase, chloroplastic/mitochondrial [Trifolium repens]|nr:tyrosine--tRNA ligase, chloroplastic/mitochondrial [Trifolium repens]